MFSVCLLCFIAFHLEAAEKGSIKFGAEIEFRSSSMFLSPSFIFTIPIYVLGWKIKNPYQFDYFSIRNRNRLLAKIEDECESCRIEGNQVYFPHENFSIELKLDVGVIEITHRPLTSTEFKQLLPLIQKEVFDRAKSLGLYASTRPILSGSHLHMDMEQAFENSPVLFRNFVVDFVNHNELYNGAIGYDPLEARDIFKTEKNFEEFRNIIERFDLEKNWGFEKLQEEFVRVGLMKISRTSQKPMMSLKSKFGTVEFRALRAYQSAHDLLLLIELFESRIDRLKGRESPVPLMTGSRKFSTADAIKKYKDYVEGAGLRWAAYEKLLPESWKSIDRGRTDLCSVLLSKLAI